MMRIYLSIVIPGLLLCISWPFTVLGQNPATIQKLINSMPYGVPASPAFELLPDKPEEVTHLVTPHDLTSQVINIMDGAKLRSGLAFDLRPFTYNVGSLKAYQKSKFKQVLWRTVLSLGTASQSKQSNNLFLGFGLKTSIIDGADPRANFNYTTALEKAYLNAVNSLPQPPLDPTLDALSKRAATLDNADTVQHVRKRFLKETWNAKKWDIGIAASARAAGSSFKADSLSKDRVGLWSAFALPLTKRAQLTISGKTSWVHTDDKTEETNRHVMGARTRFFLNEFFAASAEFSKVWSRYGDGKRLNESWNHLAIVAEVKVPIIGGWVSFAYGGDSSRRENADSKFLFSYAIATDRLLK